jgi:hypothetical protein
VCCVLSGEPVHISSDIVHAVQVHHVIFDKLNMVLKYDILVVFWVNREAMSAELQACVVVWARKSRKIIGTHRSIRS